MSSTTITTTPSRKRKGTSSRVPMKRRRLFISRAPISVRGAQPKRTVVTMRYSEAYIMPGAILDRVWNINSIFDPNRSGTGHQPYGHDTYQTMYGRYRVLKCRYRIIMSAINTIANYCVKATVVADNSSSTYTSASLASESPNAVTKLVIGGEPTIFAGTWYPGSIAGVTAQEYKSDRFQTQFGTDPSEIIVAHIVCSDFSDAAIGASSLAMNVEFVYTVEVSDRVVLAQS